MTKLEAPAPLEKIQAPEQVQPAQSAQMIDLDPERQRTLDGQIQAFLDVVLREHVHSDAFKQKVQAVHDLGSEEIRRAASSSNRLLEKPVQALSQGADNPQTKVSTTLVDLRKTVEDLDPNRAGDLFKPRKILGLFPGGNRLRDYFLKYESAQKHLNAIVTSLYDNKDELLKDNAAIEQEKTNLWGIMQKLKGYIYVGQQLDGALAARVEQLQAQDPEKARVVREEMLFAARQRVQDLLTQLAVSVQGYLALDLVRKNNLELIKGVDRATTTTISALRTAVMVSQALGQQKLVLDQISALNASTSAIIENTSKMLQLQTQRTYQQAADTTVDIEALKRSFDNVYGAMDAISEYKRTALDQMQQNVQVLAGQVDRAQQYLDRVRGETITEVAGTLNAPRSDFNL
ncbi:toxic anion resistance protein [Deinococcus maricopensis]|uniref:Toxic anion resistance family protein n=1 Tax=Deinococcus maricopensis (strain DSM 21211 / LMG 22137 / NRRL B-23946 / LB-34) TaxID=709986 RepID=E8U4T3_DEIML|nr:toxic anion resistance protein [Deinococcus maricopensis]ADV66072.1 toxic anion resistance family protein [Deinococcus maricopensis DSM 21211]